VSRKKAYNNEYQNKHHQKLLYNNPPQDLQPSQGCQPLRRFYITYIPSKNEARLQIKEMISARVNLILKIKNIITDSIRKIEISPTE